VITCGTVNSDADIASLVEAGARLDGHLPDINEHSGESKEDMLKDKKKKKKKKKKKRQNKGTAADKDEDDEEKDEDEAQHATGLSPRRGRAAGSGDTEPTGAERVDTEKKNMNGRFAPGLGISFSLTTRTSGSATIKLSLAEDSGQDRDAASHLLKKASGGDGSGAASDEERKEKQLEKPQNKKLEKQIEEAGRKNKGNGKEKRKEEGKVQSQEEQEKKREVKEKRVEEKKKKEEEQEKKNGKKKEKKKENRSEDEKKLKGNVKEESEGKRKEEQTNEGKRKEEETDKEQGSKKQHNNKEGSRSGSDQEELVEGKHDNDCKGVGVKHPEDRDDRDGQDKTVEVMMPSDGRMIHPLVGVLRVTGAKYGECSRRDGDDGDDGRAERDGRNVSNDRHHEMHPTGRLRAASRNLLDRQSSSSDERTPQERQRQHQRSRPASEKSCTSRAALGASQAGVVTTLGLSRDSPNLSRRAFSSCLPTGRSRRDDARVVAPGQVGTSASVQCASSARSAGNSHPPKPP